MHNRTIAATILIFVQAIMVIAPFERDIAVTDATAGKAAADTMTLVRPAGAACVALVWSIVASALVLSAITSRAVSLSLSFASARVTRLRAASSVRPRARPMSGQLLPS